MKRRACITRCVMMIICSFMIFESLDQVGAFNGLTRAIENCVDKANEALSSPTMTIEGKELKKPA